MPDIYEIVNPSDPYTLRAPDRATAVAACFLLGEGQYSLRARDGESACPLFLLGGDPLDWYEGEFGVRLPAVLENRLAEVAAALESVLYGSFADREEIDAATALMAPDAVAGFLAERHERRRSSLNNIGAKAWAIAAALRRAGEGAGQRTLEEVPA